MSWRRVWKRRVFVPTLFLSVLNALGALGYVESALEIAQQCEGAVNLSSVVVASGSAGTHAGLAVGLEQLLPDAS
jgi:D-cysteine desulfhydrase